MYRLTCFIQEEPHVLFPLLLPLRFKWTERQSITWTDGVTEFKIVPFASKGRGTMGYRIHFKGTPDACQYLMDQFLNRFNPLINGIEWIHKSEKTQSELIRIAEQSHYSRCSLHGIYENKEIGIVILPTNDIHLQIRGQKILVRNVSKFMRDMESTGAVFLDKPIDLFSFAEEAELS
ncbi:hypothetical protein [Sporosarcina sp. FSL K6-1508]|uniref:hypothetical protein n=1 Tax=Sporosarcina sp. FSL K6-1508 TaxID=2921553 RepID=UPI0030FAA766